MINDFGDDATRDVYDGNNTKAARKIPKSIWPVVKRKLNMLDAAPDLETMKFPPGNKLEELSGNLAGYYSIRVNDQFRIIFRFGSGQFLNVRLVDYH